MLDADKVARAVQTVRRGGQPSWRVGTTGARRRVRELREAGWTYERIGQAVGVAPSSIYRLTRQRRCSSFVADLVLGLEAP
jgi:hypothetical protein